MNESFGTKAMIRKKQNPSNLSQTDGLYTFSKKEIFNNQLIDASRNLPGGNWALSSNNTKLTLSNLSPQPSATGGVLVYTIDGDPSETALNLILSSPNLKTGSASTRYELTR